MPKLGDYGVTRTSGTVGAIIRFVTHSKVNHAFVYKGDGKVVEAGPKGAVIAQASKYPHALWSTAVYDDVTRQRIADAAVALVGTKYNFVDIAALLLVHLFGFRVPLCIRRRLSRRSREICSQLVDQAYQDAGVHLFTDGRPAADVTPEDLLELGVA